MMDVRFVDETVWLTQQQLAELFQTSRTNVVEHIRHIYEEGELALAATCREFRQVRTEWAREVARNMAPYNLDMILSVGYRVKSAVATRFAHADKPESDFDRAVKQLPEIPGKKSEK